MSEDTEDSIVRYMEKVNDFAKASEPLIVHAVRLTSMPEWEAYKQILMTKIAKDSVQFINDEKLDPREQGRIQGMRFVIDLLEVHLPRALEKKKELLLKKHGKDNSLTEKQE